MGGGCRYAGYVLPGSYVKNLRKIKDFPVIQAICACFFLGCYSASVYEETQRGFLDFSTRSSLLLPSSLEAFSSTKPNSPGLAH
jgi:hypothetical protein